MWPLEPSASSRGFAPAFARDLCSAIAARAAPLRQYAGRGRSSRKILVINGHPDPRPERFCAGLCAAYASGARSQGFEVRELQAGCLAFDGGDLDGTISADVADAMQAVRWANQLLIVFPLWLDRPPPMLSRLFDQIARTKAETQTQASAAQQPAKPAHIIVTMGMPAFGYRAKRRGSASGTAHTLSLAGVATGEPVFIGGMDAISAKQRTGWLRVLHASGISGT